MQKNETYKKDISLAQYTTISPKLFTGKSICPQVQLTLNSQILIQDVDYKITYKNNLNVGTAEIIINGIEKYTGNLSLQFEILPIDVPVKPNSEIIFSSNITTLKEISLPNGWQWQNPDLPITNLTSATAIYIGENKENYKNTTMLITLQKEEPNTPNNPNNNDKNQNNITQIKPYIILTIIVLTTVLLISLIIVLKNKRKKK